MRSSYANIWKSNNSGSNFATCSIDRPTSKTFNILIFGTILRPSVISFE